MNQWQPPHQDNPVMQGMWASFVQWAMGEAEIRQQFQDETGFDLDSLNTQSMIERMVDDATGRTDQVMQAWVEWVTENWWEPREQ